MTDHQHPTAKPEANWRTCSRAEYDALPDLSAKPEGEGALSPERAKEIVAEIAAAAERLAVGDYDLGPLPGFADQARALRTVLAALSASPPVPAVAGDTRPVEATWSDGKTHAYVNMQAALSAEAKEWRRKIGLRIVSFTFLDFDTSPTPSADQSGVIGALAKALTKGKSLIDDYFMDDDYDANGALRRVATIIDQALAAHAASIKEGK